MFKFFIKLHIHRYKEIKNTGKYSYRECNKCFDKIKNLDKIK